MRAHVMSVTFLANQPLYVTRRGIQTALYTIPTSGFSPSEILRLAGLKGFGVWRSSTLVLVISGEFDSEGDNVVYSYNGIVSQQVDTVWPYNLTGYLVKLES